MYVERYQEKDRDAVREVCISQSTSRFKDDKAKKATLALYCDEYLDHEIAFVLKDGDQVMGYTLCAPDLLAYEENMKAYEPVLIENDEAKYQRHIHTVAGYKMFYPEYPAHLHIDLKEECTGKGNGTKLIKALLKELKDRGVPGVMIFADPSNIRAVSFYKKMGFTPYQGNDAVLLCKLG